MIHEDDQTTHINIDEASTSIEGRLTGSGVISRFHISRSGQSYIKKWSRPGRIRIYIKYQVFLYQEMGDPAR